MVKLCDDTERDIGLIFDGLPEPIDPLRFHAIEYTDITLPRSQIVLRM
jgi:hypothetical protein